MLRSTATLACVGRRQAYFKDEFLSALEILHRGDLTPEQLKGSWAGAFGATQFMPTAFKKNAIDGDGDGRRDIVDSVADIVASTANKFKKDGWKSGETWGYEVEVPRDFNFALADRSKNMTIAQWEKLGIRRAGGKPFPRSSDTTFLLVPGGADGPGFLMLHNFRVIMRYNPAEAYALAIGHFADRLRGGAPLVQAWPREERVLTRAERFELQQLLSQRGFYRGEPDGNLGHRHPRRGAQLPGVDRRAGGRVCEFQRAGPVARALIRAQNAPERASNLQVDIFRAYLTGRAARRFMVACATRQPQPSLLRPTHASNVKPDGCRTRKTRCVC